MIKIIQNISSKYIFLAGKIETKDVPYLESNFTTFEKCSSTYTAHTHFVFCKLIVKLLFVLALLYFVS